MKLPHRVWFYRPEMYWNGLTTFSPFQYGHDEFARRTFCIGFSFTGKIVIAVWKCDTPEECWEDGAYSRDIIESEK